MKDFVSPAITPLRAMRAIKGSPHTKPSNQVIKSFTVLNISCFPPSFCLSDLAGIIPTDTFGSCNTGLS